MAAGLYDITTETLGKGHFAVVKLAKHCLTGESVAIKIIDKAKLNKEGLHQCGIEIRLWSRLSEHEHPNVVKLYQVIDTRSKLYLVMEYCGDDVCDLYDYLQRKNNGSGLKENDARHVFRQICSAISYCHSLRIVHRDLKPENILIIAQPQEQQIHLRVKYPLVKLIDFGFSNQWAEGEMLRTSCGSLAYSAPEILLGDQYDGPKVDMWGLGCILYILLYGNNPFMQINDSETLCRILDCSFSTPQRPTISESAIELIQALLKRDPTSRLSIQQVLTHEWLTIQDEDYTTGENGESASFDNIHKSPFVPKPMTERKNSLHDRIIEHMLSDKIINQMVSSKDNIEKALDKARCDSTASSGSGGTGTGGSGSRTASPANPLAATTTATRAIHSHMIGESMKREPQNTQTKQPKTTSSTSTSTPPTTFPPNEHYIKATYHLLKDKLLRESHHAKESSSYSSGSHKRILPPKQFPRKNYLQQQRQKAAKDAIQENEETENDANVPNKLKKETKEPKGAKELEHVHSLDLLGEEEQGVVLPLARKCSIVSEEGSVAGADGTGSDGTASECYGRADDITSNYSIGSNNSSEHMKTRPIVNIIVTDYSQIEEAEDEVMRISEENLAYQCDEEEGGYGYQQCESRDDSREEGTTDEELDQDQEISQRDLISNSQQTTITTTTGHYIKKGPLAKLSHPHITLHTVSSSPELLRSVEQDSDANGSDVSDYDNYTSAAVGGITMGHGRANLGNTMVLSNEMETCKHRDAESFALTHPHQSSNIQSSMQQQHYMSTHANTNTHSSHIPVTMSPYNVTSMRIITSSKSCNNILFNNGKNGNAIHEGGEEGEGEGGEAKVLGDSSGDGQGDTSKDTKMIKASSGDEISAAKKHHAHKTEGRNDCCRIC